MTIGLIARDDYPEQWPSLLETLMGLVCSADVNAVQGAIRALVMFAEDIQEHQLPAVAEHLFPVLLRVIAARDVRAAMCGIVGGITRHLAATLASFIPSGSMPLFFTPNPPAPAATDLSRARSDARHRRLPQLPQFAV
jgi:hypothetical protein